MKTVIQMQKESFATLKKMPFPGLESFTLMHLLVHNELTIPVNLDLLFQYLQEKNTQGETLLTTSIQHHSPESRQALLDLIHQLPLEHQITLWTQTNAKNQNALMLALIHQQTKEVETRLSILASPSVCTDRFIPQQDALLDLMKKNPSLYTHFLSIIAHASDDVQSHWAKRLTLSKPPKQHELLIHLTWWSQKNKKLPLFAATLRQNLDKLDNPSLPLTERDTLKEQLFITIEKAKHKAPSLCKLLDTAVLLPKSASSPVVFHEKTQEQLLALNQAARKATRIIDTKTIKNPILQDVIKKLRLPQLKKDQHLPFDEQNRLLARQCNQKPMLFSAIDESPESFKALLDINATLDPIQRNKNLFMTYNGQTLLSYGMKTMDSQRFNQYKDIIFNALKVIDPRDQAKFLKAAKLTLEMQKRLMKDNLLIQTLFRINQDPKNASIYHQLYLDQGDNLYKISHVLSQLQKTNPEYATRAHSTWLQEKIASRTEDLPAYTPPTPKATRRETLQNDAKKAPLPKADLILEHLSALHVAHEILQDPSIASTLLQHLDASNLHQRLNKAYKPLTAHQQLKAKKISHFSPVDELVVLWSALDESQRYEQINRLLPDLLPILSHPNIQQYILAQLNNPLTPTAFAQTLVQLLRYIPLEKRTKATQSLVDDDNQAQRFAHVLNQIKHQTKLLNTPFLQRLQSSYTPPHHMPINTWCALLQDNDYQEIKAGLSNPRLAQAWLALIADLPLQEKLTILKSAALADFFNQADTAVSQALYHELKDVHWLKHFTPAEQQAFFQDHFTALAQTNPALFDDFMHQSLRHHSFHAYLHHAGSLLTVLATIEQSISFAWILKHTPSILRSPTFNPKLLLLKDEGLRQALTQAIFSLPPEQQVDFFAQHTFMLPALYQQSPEHAREYIEHCRDFPKAYTIALGVDTQGYNLLMRFLEAKEVDVSGIAFIETCPTEELLKLLLQPSPASSLFTITTEKNLATLVKLINTLSIEQKEQFFNAQDPQWLAQLFVSSQPALGYAMYKAMRDVPCKSKQLCHTKNLLDGMIVANYPDQTILRVLDDITSYDPIDQRNFYINNQAVLYDFAGNPNLAHQRPVLIKKLIELGIPALLSEPDLSIAKNVFQHLFKTFADPTIVLSAEYTQIFHDSIKALLHKPYNTQCEIQQTCAFAFHAQTIRTRIHDLNAQQDLCLFYVGVQIPRLLENRKFADAYRCTEFFQQCQHIQTLQTNEDLWNALLLQAKRDFTMEPLCSIIKTLEDIRLDMASLHYVNNDQATAIFLSELLPLSFAKLATFNEENIKKMQEVMRYSPESKIHWMRLIQSFPLTLQNKIHSSENTLQRLREHFKTPVENQATSTSVPVAVAIPTQNLEAQLTDEQMESFFSQPTDNIAIAEPITAQKKMLHSDPQAAPSIAEPVKEPDWRAIFALASFDPFYERQYYFHELRQLSDKYPKAKKHYQTLARLAMEINENNQQTSPDSNRTSTLNREWKTAMSSAKRELCQNYSWIFKSPFAPILSHIEHAENALKIKGVKTIIAAGLQQQPTITLAHAETKKIKLLMVDQLMTNVKQKLPHSSIIFILEQLKNKINTLNNSESFYHDYQAALLQTQNALKTRVDPYTGFIQFFGLSQRGFSEKARQLDQIKQVIQNEIADAAPIPTLKR